MPQRRTAVRACARMFRHSFPAVLTAFFAGANPYAHTPPSAYAQDVTEMPGVIASAVEKNISLREQARGHLVDLANTMAAEARARERAAEENFQTWQQELNLPPASNEPVEEIRARLREEIIFWRSADTHLLAEVPDLLQGIADGLKVAEADGQNIEKLTTLYEKTKEAVRTANFTSFTSGTILDESPSPLRTAGYYLNFMNLLMEQIGQKEIELAEARRRHQEYRVGLYKRVTVAFIDALISGDQPKPVCTEATARPVEAVYGGRTLNLPGCPDPTVDKLRAYWAAVQTMASAEVEQAQADFTELVAEQQLISDTASAVPYVGEALDLWALATGRHALTGEELGGFEYALTGTLFGMTEVAPQAWSMMMRRHPEAELWLQHTYEGLSAMAARQATSGLDGMSGWLSRHFDVDPARFEALRSRLADVTPGYEPPPGIATILRSLRETGNARLAIADMSELLRTQAYIDSEVTVRSILGTYQDYWRGLRNVGDSLDEIRPSVVDEHVSAFLDAAEDSNTIILTRPVNPTSKPRVLDNAATKPMPVKSKSAEAGPIKGLLPADPRLNKKGSRLAQVRAEIRALEEAGGDAGTLTALRRKADELEGEIREGVDVLADCRANNCAIEVDYLLENGNVLHVDVHPETNAPRWLEPDGNGRFRDLETGETVSFPPGNDPAPVKVLADPETGQPYTADYDILAFGEGRIYTDGAPRPIQTPEFNAETGYITERQIALGEDINANVIAEQRRRWIEAGNDPDEFIPQNVVHHGPETNYPKSPGVDYPLTAFEPGGNVVYIQACDEACMIRWCETTMLCRPADLCLGGRTANCIAIDPDRLLKDYFHNMRLKGYDMMPNAAWDWGNYDPRKGWAGPDIQRARRSMPPPELSPQQTRELQEMTASAIDAAFSGAPRGSSFSQAPFTELDLTLPERGSLSVVKMCLEQYYNWLGRFQEPDYTPEQIAAARNTNPETVCGTRTID